MLKSTVARSLVGLCVAVCGGNVLAAGYSIQYLMGSTGLGPDYDVNNSGTVAGSPGYEVRLDYIGEVAVWTTSPGASQVPVSYPLKSAAPPANWPVAGMPLPPDWVADEWAVANASAVGINNSGAIAGVVGYGGEFQPFVLRAGAVSLLPVPKGLTKAYAVDINDEGRVVGYAWGPSYGERHVLSWYNDVVTDLSVLPGGSVQSGIAHAVNSSGHIAGAQGVAGYTQRAAVWIDGVMNYLPREGQTIRGSTAWDINDLGQVIGGTATESGYAAAFWSEGGIEVFDGMFGENPYSEGYAINNRGQALIGAYGSLRPRAYLLDNGKLIDLSEEAGIPVTSAWSINDKGQIVGMTIGGEHVLLTPVPEPTTLALTLGGLLSAVLVARRRQGGI